MPHLSDLMFLVMVQLIRTRLATKRKEKSHTGDGTGVHDCHCGGKSLCADHFLLNGLKTCL
jgi:hypothetical protein